MNQASTFATSIETQLSRLLGAIPILLPILQRLEVVSIINRYCPCQADVDEGTVGLILTLNRLMSPRPLYKVSEWMTQTILDEALGISAEKMHDRRLGDFLNRYIRSIEEIAKRINVRKYKKKSYTQDQIDKVARKYTSVRNLVDIQLSGTDGNLILSFKVNKEQLELAKERDGRYLLATNRPLTEEEMLLHFKRQDRIEKHIHTFKGPIRVRPMFLHKQERIESLVFICMLALLVFSILETLAKRANILMTAESILKQFQTPVVVYTIFKDGSCFKQVAPLTQFQSAFIQALDLPDHGIYLKLIKLE